jgi:hypothetical protein
MLCISLRLPVSAVILSISGTSKCFPRFTIIFAARLFSQPFEIAGKSGKEKRDVYNQIQI